MKPTARSIAAALVLALCALPTPGWGFSTVSATNVGNVATLTANLNFSLVVPRFLLLRVGSIGVIDSISFNPTAAQVGTGAVIAGTGGDLGGGAVTVLAQGNSTGTGSLVYQTTTAALTDGTQTIAWSTIQVASAGSATIAHPAALSNASATPVTISSGLAGVFNLSATWTYSWSDGGTVNPASSYSGRVAYSLSQP
ncbi:MAG: hypothetical protein OEW21_06985 [Betaproteobacteria bacterium]|nr:hypothetical protein [Betaproteobacteria bacterium]